jgi:hypothetical protein
MWWIVGGLVAVVAAVCALGLWLLGPTVRTIFRPGFEPTARDEASVLRAQQSADSHGAGQGS